MFKTKTIIFGIVLIGLITAFFAVQKTKLIYNGRAASQSFINEFPVYPEATYANTAPDVEGAIIGVWKVTSPSNLADWYRVELKKHGWTIKSSNEYFINAERRGVLLTVEFSSEETNEPTQIVATFYTSAPPKVTPGVMKMKMNDDNLGG